MWWHGREKSGGSLLPEDKKVNMWHGRGNSSGSWPPAFPRSPYKAKEFLKESNNLLDENKGLLDK